jgi:glycosyltransferase involved in cell wall biosynthesis
MRVLHLFSDWKWTGPAEPTLSLCKGLMEQGISVTLACRRPLEGYPQSVWEKAVQRGVPTTTELHLNRYLRPVDTIKDLRGLAPYLLENRFDLIHCHLSHDHFLGGWASRRLRPVVPVVRTNHKARPLKASLGNRWLLKRWTDGLIEFSKVSEEQDVLAFGLSRSRVLRVEGAVDLERFDPAKTGAQVRAKLGVREGELLIGVVARMQRHRRFDLILEAMAILKDRGSPVKLMILGRGTRMQEVAVEPAKRLGIQDRVIFPGYRLEDYVDYLAAMDIKVFLVPGSDGTCRALREAMAMGKPVVATRRGMLPEILEGGRAGLLVDEDPQDLAEAISRLATDRGLRASMGVASREKALRDFSVKAQASKVARFYEALLGMGPLR